MRRISRKFGDVAKGDLTVTVSAKGHDEFQDLAGSATNMITNTKKLVNQVSNATGELEVSAQNVGQASELIHEYSQDITRAIGEINEGMEEQSRHAQECVEKTDILSNEIQEVSHVVERVEKLVGETEGMINKGMEIVQVLGDRAGETTQMTVKVSESIESLRKESEIINSFVATITEITEQTNLLSLNASIEAARAGDAGKGFAVVAEQIRTLSTETRASSGQIGDALARLDEISGKMTSSIEETLSLIQQTLEKIAQTGGNVDKITADSSLLGNHIQVIDAAMKEVEASNQQLVENMEQVSNIVSTMTTSIGNSDDISKKMLSKYDESATNINNIENVIQDLMHELGIGGFMGVDDIHPGMKAKISLTETEDKPYSDFHGEIADVTGNTISLSFPKEPDLAGATSCKLQVTVGNVLYCWDEMTLRPAQKDEKTLYIAVITSRPQIQNRRKYPRVDMTNACTVTVKQTGDTYKARLDNISANGFALITYDNFFADSKGKDLHVEIENFPVPYASTVEGHVIRSSFNEGTYIVGCQMPEDNRYIMDYIDDLLANGENVFQ